MNKNTKIGIAGGGIEGIEVAKYFSRHGYSDITVFDENEKLDIELPTGIKRVFRAACFDDSEKCDVVFRSPGIHINKLRSINNKPQITSLTKYFFEKCPCKIIGITGTKGKGTTATLLCLMLKEANFDVYLGGNIGRPPLEFLDQLKPDSWVILELSSFQLQDLKKSPHIAVVLGIRPDHLDYHKDFDEYLEAKSAIVKYQSDHDIAVFNRDYANSEHFFGLTKAGKFFVDASARREREQGEESGSASSESKRALSIKDGAHIAGTKIVYCEGPKCELIGDIGKIALLGRHNLENVLPAAVVARQLNVSISVIQKVLYSFKGLPHRLEYVREINGVQFYNDSFSTTPETSIAAVFAFNKPAILIAGGSDKGADYNKWALELQKSPNLKIVILIGALAEKMNKALKNVAAAVEFPLKIYMAKNLDEAVEIAAKNAVAKDIVLLSPAAASFDMFKNYKDRGERFMEIVKSLR